MLLAEEELAGGVLGVEDHQLSAGVLRGRTPHAPPLPSSPCLRIPYFARTSSSLSSLHAPSVSHSRKASMVLLRIGPGMLVTLWSSFFQNQSFASGKGVDKIIYCPCQLSSAVIRCCEDARVAAKFESLFQKSSTLTSCSAGCGAKRCQLW